MLVALYESEIDFEPRLVDFADPASSAELFELWPVGKIPLLRDGDHLVPETTIIVEHLALHHAGARALIPSDPALALEARLWDRFFDLYVGVPMQRIVLERLRPTDRRDPLGVDEARAALRTAYSMLEQRMATRTWAAGDSFGLADCAAAPVLFYAEIAEPFSSTHPRVAAYLERLLKRPSFARVLREAKPYLGLYPLRDQMPARLLAACE
ncbi:putative glutathione S-transferase-like protein [Sandaracinus amylolyticus]|uniref:Putative glutathione S-transferase-like protein n=1 Tax=Sandaracinus amylolyticus TaxID=927083 RepID=A0A0F6WAW5_9BACT|nr:putative glutathione S-transferase-like protein [Sandaracinus amylolyticus]